MTPKEKANELVNAMGITVSYGTNYTGGDDIPMYRNQYAKQCALIAVDEILSVLPQSEYLEDRGEFNENRERIYWQEVKQEIEKL